jgi:cytochrome c-type biogenesis protein CcmE
MRYRAFVLPAAGLLVVLIGFVLWGNLNSNLVYYVEPTEAIEQRAEIGPDERFRLGGRVVAGSLVDDGETATFELSDGTSTVLVEHNGIPPQLFREGIGAIVEGSWNGDVFHSDALIVKHDETYEAPHDAETD